MKPKEYVKKYNLRETEKFNHEYFVADLAVDFKSNLEVIQEMNQLSYNRFQQCVKEIKEKFDNIFIRSILKEKPEKLWNYFYATVIVSAKDKLFGEYLKKKEKEERWKDHTSKFTGEMFNSFLKDIMGGYFEQFIGVGFESFFNSVNNSVIDKSDIACFEDLGLTKDSTKEEVMGKFRSLVLIHHPDKGGDPKRFRRIVEAKNKCLLYLNV